jgi:serine/threonine-protein kinase
VIPVHAFGVDDDGQPLLVMKRVDGVDLGTLVREPEHPAWRARGAGDDRLVASLEILMQVCQTLEFAHEQRVLHRDVKPENVMVGGFGEVYLLDWGVACLLDDPEGARPLVGTPAYMAPEMVQGEPPSRRTDVYLLGATLHEILTGRPRHEGRTLMEVLRAALESAPCSYGPTVPADLAALCNRATSRSPEARPESAAAFREALAQHLRHRGARALSAAATERVTALEAMLAAAPAGAPPATLPDAYRLLSEARFGFVEALREHAANEEAIAGTRRCVEASVDLELRLGHVEAAAALLRELAPPSPELERRVEDARHAAAEREAEGARLRAMAQDLDPRVSRRKRVAVIGVFVAIAVACSAYASLQTLEATRLLVLGLAFAAVGVVPFVAFRRELLANEFNRRAAVISGVAIVTLVVHRMVAWFQGSSVDATLAVDLVLLSALAGAGTTVMPGAAWSVLPLAAGLAVVLLVPEHASAAFSVATVGFLVVMARVVGRGIRTKRD